MEYKRLTTKDESGDIILNCQECQYHELFCMICTDYHCINALKTRLAELEDKIEQGVLASIEDMLKNGELVSKEWHDEQVMHAENELQEYQNRIENGTLIEIDHSLIGEGIIGIHHYTDGTYQLDLDENIVIGFAIDGVITWNGTHQFNDEFRNGMFFIDNEKGRAEAEKKLLELWGEV